MGWSASMSRIGYWSGGRTRPIWRVHWSQAAQPQKVVHPQEAAPFQILAQPCDLDVVEADGADVGHEDEGVLEELLVVQRQHHVVRVAGPRPAHRRGRELVEAAHEVHVAFGVVGVPALAQRLAPHAVVHDAREDEVTVDRGIGVRKARRRAAAPVLHGGGARRLSGFSRERVSTRAAGPGGGVLSHLREGSPDRVRVAPAGGQRNDTAGYQQQRRRGASKAHGTSLARGLAPDTWARSKTLLR